MPWRITNWRQGQSPVKEAQGLVEVPSSLSSASHAIIEGPEERLVSVGWPT